MHDHDPPTGAMTGSVLVQVRELLRAGDPVGALTVLEDLALLVCAAPEHRGRTTVMLSAREREVLVWLPTHLSNAEIGRQLHMSVNTVKSHLKGLYVTLGVGSRSEAVTVARELGLLDGCRWCGSRVELSAGGRDLRPVGVSRAS